MPPDTSKIRPWTGEPILRLVELTSGPRAQQLLAIVRGGGNEIGDHVVMSEDEARDVLEALAQKLGYVLIRPGQAPSAAPVKA